MTSSPQIPDDRADDRGTPRPGDAGQRRDRSLRLSRRLTRSLVSVTAALVLGFSVLATTTGTPGGGTADPVTTTDTGSASATTTSGTTATDATGTTDDGAQAAGTSSSDGSSSNATGAPSTSSSTPAVTSGAS